MHHPNDALCLFRDSFDNDFEFNVNYDIGFYRFPFCPTTFWPPPPPIDMCTHVAVVSIFVHSLLFIKNHWLRCRQFNLFSKWQSFWNRTRMLGPHCFGLLFLGVSYCHRNNRHPQLIAETCASHMVNGSIHPINYRSTLLRTPFIQPIFTGIEFKYKTTK